MEADKAEGPTAKAYREDEEWARKNCTVKKGG